MEWRDAIAAITGDALTWEWPLSEAATRWEIDTDERLAEWLAQCGHESGGFKRLVENLNYSPQGLLSTWPARFTPTEAVEFAHDGQRIAERVYGGRMGNGAEGSGDGFRYRGRGLFQLTGRNAYRAARVIGPDFEAEPDLVAEPKWAAYTAAEFWQRNGCNEIADAGDFAGVSGVINRGDRTKPAIGMNLRLAWLEKTRGALA